MIVRSAIIFIFTLLTFFSFAQSGLVFPTLNGETLHKKNITIPDDVKGKYTLLGLAYSQKAEDDLKTWYIPAYNKFIAKTGMMDDMYDVNIYFVPMFSGAKKVAKPKAMKELEKKSDSKIHPYVLFYAGDLSPYRDQLKMNSKSEPYFYLLDSAGRIVWTVSGDFKQEYFDNLETILSK